MNADATHTPRSRARLLAWTSRRAQRLAGILVMGCLTLSAQTDLTTPAEDAPVPERISLWQPLFNVRAGAGYKDNVLLSPLKLGGSGLNFTELEATLVRLPLDGTQFTAFLIGEDTRFWRPGLVDKEQTILALAQLKQDFAGSWQAGISAQYLYHDEVFDLSSTEQNITTVQAQANGFALRPSLRRELTAGWWTELELEAARYDFIAPLDDYWEGGPKLSVGLDYGDKSELALAWKYRERAYDTREQITAAGVALPGRSLALGEQEGEISWRHYWDGERHWRTTLRLTGAREADNGEGYFDYWRWQVGGQMDFRSKNWKVLMKARASLLEFSQQPVSATDPRIREKFSLSTTLRVERRLTKHWKALAEYIRELASSNRPLDGYRANTVTMGMEWEY